jgi:hypothetical protein
VDAVDRADRDAGLIDDVDARLGDDVGQGSVLLVAALWSGRAGGAPS